MDGPRTHYQISLTARQAMGLFVGLFLALGVAFFLGLMSGLSGREPASAERPSAPPESRKRAEASSEALPPVETAVPTAASGPSRTEIAGAAALEPTAPATLQPFEDAGGEEAGPAPAASKPATPPHAKSVATAGEAPAPASKAAPPAGKTWVQVASLLSHDEANALSTRLSRHGFHVVTITAPGPKGKVYRVRVGPYRSEEEAGRAASRLAKQEKINQPWVVPEGK